MSTEAPPLTRTIPGLTGFTGSQHRLLTAEEEVQLARQVAVGRAELGSPPTTWSFDDLPAGSASREAAETLVLMNMRLVLAMAQREQPGEGRSFEDTVQDGTIGLMRAVLGFDPDAGTRFAAYAPVFIRRAMVRGRQFEGSLVRLPVHVHDKVLALRRHAEQLDCDLGTLVAAHPDGIPELGISADLLRSIWSWSVPFEPLDVVVDASAVALSPDPQPAPSLGEEDAVTELLRLMSRVDARAVSVVARRFGLLGHERATHQEVADELGVGREHVRLVEQKALAAALTFLTGLSKEDWHDLFAA